MTTQALEAAIDYAIRQLQTGSSVGKALGALTRLRGALTEPFDPSKHLDGWKTMIEGEVWRLATPEHRWELQWIMNSFWRIVQNDRIVFEGHIPTRAFWEALCGALNIKPHDD